MASLGSKNHNASRTVSNNFNNIHLLSCFYTKGFSLFRYLSTALLRNIFMFKCRLPLLRLVPALHLLSLPVIFTTLEAYHQRLPPPDDLTSPTISSVALASFPPLWFFGFLFYTDVPGIAFVLAAFVAQTKGSNWLASLVSRLPSQIFALLSGFKPSSLTWLA
jgi:hypothetical protein